MLGTTPANRTRSNCWRSGDLAHVAHQLIGKPRFCAIQAKKISRREGTWQQNRALSLTAGEQTACRLVKNFVTTSRDPPPSTSAYETTAQLKRASAAGQTPARCRQRSVPHHDSLPLTEAHSLAKCAPSCPNGRRCAETLHCFVPF
jgi:hypothetical protein